MVQHNRIVTYGLTEEKNALVAKNLPTKEYTLWEGDVYTDLIAVDYAAMIVYRPALTKEEIADIADFYVEIGGPADETVLWLGEGALPAELKRKFKCYSDFEAIADKLKYLLLDAHKRHLKAVEFSNRVAMILRVLREIRTNPGISTRGLADKLELSTRTVQRHIETLRMAGEVIDYDRTKRGWQLLANKSELLGEW